MIPEDLTRDTQALQRTDCKHVPSTAYSKVGVPRSTDIRVKTQSWFLCRKSRYSRVLVILCWVVSGLSTLLQYNPAAWY